MQARYAVPNVCKSSSVLGEGGGGDGVTHLCQMRLSILLKHLPRQSPPSQRQLFQMSLARPRKAPAIRGMRNPCPVSKHGQNVLFCMPNRTNCTLLVSVDGLPADVPTATVGLSTLRSDRPLARGPPAAFWSEPAVGGSRCRCALAILPLHAALRCAATERWTYSPPWTSCRCPEPGCVVGRASPAPANVDTRQQPSEPDARLPTHLPSSRPQPIPKPIGQLVLVGTQNRISGPYLAARAPAPLARTRETPIGHTRSYLACRTGHSPPTRRQCIGSTFQR
jgi:hypothetical protein